MRKMIYSLYSFDIPENIGGEFGKIHDKVINIKGQYKGPYNEIHEKAVKEGFDKNGKLIHRSVYDETGNYHSFDDEPSLSRWNENGILILRTWCIHGKLARENGPAEQMWYENGVLCKEVYCNLNVKGESCFHRIAEPAVIKFTKNGHHSFIAYWENGNFISGGIFNDAGYYVPSYSIMRKY